MTKQDSRKPAILAPAGSRDSFFAALSAGADGIYCGLKQFSARMAAENFNIDELSVLIDMAHERKTEVFVTMNSLVKPDELDNVGKLIDQLNRNARPDALIVQDPALVSLAEQAGFKGDIHLSTLANVSFPSALKLARFLPRVNRVVVPRELTIDEIRAMSDQCPKDLSLEVFIHGALCYGVSGRCYWSSYLGGKSGLRGRCVQPCRRIYARGEQRARYFSCKDLWVDVLTKVMMTVPNISAFKIEGRKKGPHYVYYTVKAYKLLRDNPGDNQAKKQALEYLEYGLGREGTHYNLLSQRPWNPIDIDGHTGSGQMVGKIAGPGSKPYIEPREPLFADDRLRIGYEDDSWHRTVRISKHVPKRGRYYLSLSKSERPANGAAVFLIDRREPELASQIGKLEAVYENSEAKAVKPSKFKLKLPARAISRQQHPIDVTVRREPFRPEGSRNHAAVWLSGESRPEKLSVNDRMWWWLPPVIWPDQEEEIRKRVERAYNKGFKKFVINAPWQMIFFPPGKRLTVWAGPFCNTANELAVEHLAGLGCEGAIVSPELGADDYTRLPAKSPLPLGIVVYGNWPLCISRTKAETMPTDRLFKSPRSEHAWVHPVDKDFWIFPEWPIDLQFRTETLQKLGYRMFVQLIEPIPKGIRMKKRPGKWNWDVGLS